MNETDAPLYNRFHLVRSFLIAAGAVVTLGMGVIGLWVTARVEEAASDNAATMAALYVDSIIAPLTQALSTQPTFDEATRNALDERLTRGLMNRELFAFKIWRPDGVIAYASDPSLIGKRFAMSDGLAAAAEGRIHTEFHASGDTDNALEEVNRIPVLEVYSPIRDAATGHVVGVVEFYDAATELVRELRQARLESWLVVGMTTAGMLGILFVIIVRGGRVIATQRAALKEQVKALSGLLEQNRSLTERVDQANRRAAALNERHMRRISAEIHDGPVQLLAFASLRLNSPRTAFSAADHAPIREALEEAIGELRQISRGLTLPELDSLSALDVARRAAKAHESRTGRRIPLVCAVPLPDISQAEKICLYRFIQEGLNNAERHAGGTGLAVELDVEDKAIVARVRDRGPGFDPGMPSEGLGLSGLRERLAGLGGELMVNSVAGEGAVLTARLPVGSAG